MAIGLAGCSKEPVWQGKPLAEWLGELNDPNHYKSTEAEAAVRSMGTNSVPFLIERLLDADPLIPGSREDKHGEAVSAFRILGDSARPFLPSLGALLTNRVAIKEMNYMAIAQSMAGIGEQAKPWLVEALNHPRAEVRMAGMVALVDLGEKARDALPVVMKRLVDEEAEVRGYALFLVRNLSYDRKVAIRVLRNATNDADHQVRSFAERSLKELEQD